MSAERLTDRKHRSHNRKHLHRNHVTAAPNRKLRVWLWSLEVYGEHLSVHTATSASGDHCDPSVTPRLFTTRCCSKAALSRRHEHSFNISVKAPPTSEAALVQQRSFLVRLHLLPAQRQQPAGGDDAFTDRVGLKGNLHPAVIRCFINQVQFNLFSPKHHHTPSIHDCCLHTLHPPFSF